MGVITTRLRIPPSSQMTRATLGDSWWEKSILHGKPYKMHIMSGICYRIRQEPTLRTPPKKSTRLENSTRIYRYLCSSFYTPTLPLSPSTLPPSPPPPTLPHPYVSWPPPWHMCYMYAYVKELCLYHPSAYFIFWRKKTFMFTITSQSCSLCVPFRLRWISAQISQIQPWANPQLGTLSVAGESLLSRDNMYICFVKVQVIYFSIYIYKFTNMEGWVLKHCCCDPETRTSTHPTHKHTLTH